MPKRLLLMCVLLGCSTSIMTAHCQSESPKPEQVSLRGVYSTTRQDGFKSLRKTLDDKGKASFDSMEEFFIATTRLSNAFVVRGDNVNDAVGEMASLLSAENPRVKNSKTIWAMIYLGTKSGTPPYFVVTKIEQTNKTLRITFEVPPSVVRTADLLPYIYIVGLGEPKADSMTVELFDKDKNMVVMSRAVSTK